MIDVLHFDQLSLQQVQDWLDNVQSGAIQVPNNFDWDMLGAQAITNYAETHHLDWAKIAIQGYALRWDRLAPPPSDRLARFRLQSPEMHLRAALIAEFGAKLGDPLLDPAFVLDWARGWLNSLPPSRDHLDDPQTLINIALRKGVLNVLSVLKPLGILDQDPIFIRAMTTP